MTDEVPENTFAQIAYEQMLNSRYALQNHPAHRFSAGLDRSATVLLARLSVAEPMTIAELAEAFGLDISTIHRQVAAAIKAGLIERIDDPAGGQAKKHQPTAEGSRLLAAEFAYREATTREIMQGWSEEDTADYLRLVEKFNRGIEHLRNQPWPR